MSAEGTKLDRLRAANSRKYASLCGGTSEGSTVFHTFSMREGALSSVDCASDTINTPASISQTSSEALAESR